jgi:hypothetical protein
MLAVANYVLEHFYYGQFVRDGKPEGELRLLASSAGVQPEQVAEAVQQALVPPLVGSPNGSWALVRGKKIIPFIMVQSQLGSAGQSVLHFVLMPVDVLRAMGGNLKAMMSLVQTDMPAYEKQGDTLEPVTLPQVEPQTADEQIDDILALMNFTRNRMDTIESVLAGIVQGVPVVVQNAPPNLEERVTFVQGLLAFLPPSARFGVTFATHSVPSTKIDSQIRFYAGDTPEDGGLLYDWSAAAVSGNVVEDDYSHFIVSQLRLDAELVIQQTRALTSVASWRIKRGDKLSEALSYASYRLKLDNALVNNQPVEIDEVAKVLAEDPTLDGDLRTAYARHLLAFALALGDTGPAEPIAILPRQQPDLEQAILQQFTDTLADGKAGLIFETLARWLANPMGPVGTPWVDLTHRAALMEFDALIRAGDLAAITRFLERVHEMDPGVQMSRIVPKMIELALPLSIRDRKLAETVFLLAVHYLDIEILRKLLGGKTFIAQLPRNVGRLVPYLTGEDRGAPPSGLLMDVARSFGEKWEPILLMRFVEAAMQAARPDLLDTPALDGLQRLAASPWGAKYEEVLRWVATQLSNDTTLMSLEEPGPRYLLQILLARHAYGELANQMLHQARVLYPGDLQIEYAQMVRYLFAETPIPTEEVPVALTAISNGGIKSLPLIMAHIGALEGHRWSPQLDQTAADVTGMIFDNRTILNVMPTSALLALLNFFIKRRDANNAIRVGGLIPDAAVRAGSKGVAIMSRTYQRMNWDDSVRIAALELLRRYIRRSDDAFARKAIDYFGSKLGADVQQALEATYTLKLMMGGVDIDEYAEFLHVTAEFLNDTMLAYIDPKQIPTIGALMNNLDSMPGGLSNDERQLIAQEMLALARAIPVIGAQYKANRPRDLESHIAQLLEGKAAPTSALDVMRVMGGYFSKGKRYVLKLTPPSSLSQQPLGQRSAPMLKQQSQIVNSVLRSLLRAFPRERRVMLGVRAIRAELDSLWGEISLHRQRELVRNLAIDFQRVADLIPIIDEQGNLKALDGDSGIGRKLDANKQRPANTLEFYRFVHGYFKMRTR